MAPIPSERTAILLRHGSEDRAVDAGDSEEGTTSEEYSSDGADAPGYAIHGTRSLRERGRRLGAGAIAIGLVLLLVVVLSSVGHLFGFGALPSAQPPPRTLPALDEGGLQAPSSPPEQAPPRSDAFGEASLAQVSPSPLWQAPAARAPTPLPGQAPPTQAVSSPPGQAPAKRAACVRYVNALQFSPHAECYARSFDPARHSPTRCSLTAQAKIDELLSGQSHHMDFANIIYSNGQYRPPAPAWRMLGTRCPLWGPPYSGDDVMLLYNQQFWTPFGSPGKGCMGAQWDNRAHRYEENLRRPWLLQAFQHKSAGVKVIVAAVHFPHTAEYKANVWQLRDAVRSMVIKHDTPNVLLIADTNMNRWKSSAEIMHDIGASSAYDTVKSTQLFASCCMHPASRPEARDFGIVGFDRVVANFGTRMNSNFPLAAQDAVKWGKQNMHLPVIGSLAISGPSEADCTGSSDGAGQGWEDQTPDLGGGGGRGGGGWEDDEFELQNEQDDVEG